ncbi:hypothetical protein CEG14_15145 [Bordetella genomosp. 1]|uniref:DUF2069 domain-containing protein n=1 Tax=Bordetella genomosp. 1 TaxID=1395607 RepID=A0A261SHR8_9BORD|nr:DUF2069 domain-containing protein [Bordetella genomosp. 1]OZI36340.1 hypothetical protein CEG14_15145 [Bordetella genomosp. 1]
MTAELNPNLRRLATASLLALIVLCVAWELWLAPLRPGGSWLVLKALPLVAPLRGIARGRLYTYQWASMMMLLYVMEGVVRATSDPGAAAALLGAVEAILATVFFLSAIFYVRPAKRAARERRA